MLYNKGALPLADFGKYEIFVDVSLCDVFEYEVEAGNGTMAQ